MTRIDVGSASPSGLQRPNYFNGRLLTASDLRSDQDAVLRRDQWLGEAVGSGVVHGLEVSGFAGSSELHVSPGTGVCPGGTAVHLEASATLDLDVVTTASGAPDGARFGDCRPASTETKAPAAGAYLLVARPTSSYDGKVPVRGADSATLTVPCGSRWEVEEVAFAAIRLDGFTSKTDSKNRRNLLAHWCFGSAKLDELALSGFVAPVPFRGIDTPADLGPCDLPLAVFDWNGSALRFVDQWSSRRRTVRPSATDRLSVVLDDSRTAEGEARFLQFQDQLGEAITGGSKGNVRALDTFPWFPPAAIVPIDPASAIKPLLALAKRPVETDFFLNRTITSEQPTLAMTLELVESGVVAAPTGTFGSSSLGALSKMLADIQADIDKLEAQVKALTEKGGSGGAKSSLSAQALGRATADWVAIHLADAAGAGVDLTQFLDGLEVRIGVVDRETVDFTIRRSWYDEPLELGDGPTLNVFFVTTDADKGVAPYVLVTKRIRSIRWIDTRARTLEGRR